ncbi:MAG: hypothetical protein WBS20_14600, partial [Lysobacterales bacterium]
SLCRSLLPDDEVDWTDWARPGISPDFLDDVFPDGTAHETQRRIDDKAGGVKSSARAGPNVAARPKPQGKEICLALF